MIHCHAERSEASLLSQHASNRDSSLRVGMTMQETMASAPAKAQERSWPAAGRSARATQPVVVLRIQKINTICCMVRGKPFVSWILGFQVIIP